MTYLEVALFSWIISGSCAQNSIHDRLYKSFDVVYPCITRSNGTHVFGCSSKLSGNEGAIEIISSDNNFNSLANEWNEAPYIVILYADMFTKENLLKLNKFPNVNGVILAMKEGSRDGLDNFSHEDTCPNRYSGLAAPPKLQNTCDAQKPWNSVGTSLMLTRFNFPIFMVDDKDTTDSIENCYKKFNLLTDKTKGNRPLCSLSMDAHMYNVASSQVCLRRGTMFLNFNNMKYCDFMGSTNVYAPIYPLHAAPSYKERSVIVVAAKLDATSMFNGFVPGALSAATSIVTLLLTAKQLTAMLPNKYDDNENALEMGKNIFFVFFNGEAYDYIGSSKMVYDMSNGEFPYKGRSLKKEDIRLFIELSQIKKSKEIYIHTVGKSDEYENFVEKFKNHSDVKITTLNSIPPSSVQSFLVEDDGLAGVVMSSYGDSFDNGFYNSIFDDAANINFKYENSSDIPNDSIQAFLVDFSTALAKSIYNVFQGEFRVWNTNVTKQEANELLNCYVKDQKCEFTKRRAKEYDVFSNSAPNYYVGVNAAPSAVTSLTVLHFAYMTGKKVNLTKEECHDHEFLPYSRFWIYGGENGTDYCVQSTVNVSLAISPAFFSEDYNMTSGEYPTWTESVWHQIELKMYLRPNPRTELITFIAALTILFVNVGAVFQISRMADKFFNLNADQHVP